MGKQQLLTTDKEWLKSMTVVDRRRQRLRATADRRQRLTTYVLADETEDLDWVPYYHGAKKKEDTDGKNSCCTCCTQVSR